MSPARTRMLLASVAILLACSSGLQERQSASQSPAFPAPRLLPHVSTTARTWPATRRASAVIIRTIPMGRLTTGIEVRRCKNEEL